MRILGIDLGTKSVKAVELDSVFGRFEIHEYHEQPVEMGSDGRPDPRLAVARLIASLSRHPDKIAVATRTGTATFRNLRIPTRGKKAIQAAVGFELEDELPFPAERSIHDFSILGQTKHGSVVHVAASMKSQIASQIHFWASAGVEPDLITTEAWAYRTLLNRAIPGTGAALGDRPTLVVQIGESHTTLYAHWRGAPALARETDWGGRDLTQAIAEKYAISLDAAEKAKMDGFVIPPDQQQDVTPEQLEFSNTLLKPLGVLLRDLHQAVLTCKNVTKEAPETIFLAGGTALLPGLAAYIYSNLGIPVRPLKSLSMTSASGVTYSDATEAAFALPLGLALCLVGQERLQAINFRKGEFAKHGQTHEFQLQNMRWAFVSGGAILASLLLSLGVQSQVYKSKLTDVDRQLRRSVQSFFGQISESAVRTYIASTSTLRTAVNQELEQQRQLHALVTPDPNSPLDALRNFSGAIPKDVVVDTTQIQIGSAPSEPYSAAAERNARFTFIIANPQTAERLGKLLGDLMTNVEKGKTEEVTVGGAKKWKVTFSGKLPAATAAAVGGKEGQEKGKTHGK